jgi:1-deoxy-D-xylulose-5-phosphate synthase
MRFAKPLDEKLLHKIFTKFDNIITIEDGCLQGGFGSAILEFMANNDYKSSVKRLGIPDEFVHHGTQEELHKEYFYDTSAIVKTVYEILAKKLVSQVG